MALQSAAITITGVTEPQARLYRIIFHMVVDDDTAGLPGLDVTYPINYKHGNDVAGKVTEVVKFFQEKIDRYKNAVVVFESAALTTAVSSIQSGLVV